MTRGWKLISLVLSIALLVGLGCWRYPALRRVDGRSAAQWLAFAEQAGRTVSYHAEGATWANGQRAHFTLEQGRAGCYTLQTTDANGQRCTMGCDGHRLWYTNDQHAAKVVSAAPSSTTPAPVAGRILGTGELAGCSVVRLAVQSGDTWKEITVDRHTGVILAMTTQFRHRRISAMRVEKIAYRDVTVHPCTLPTAGALATATPAQVRKALGRDALQATWLPAGMQLAQIYQTVCCCGHQGMIVVRYSDGVSTLTLSQTANCPCEMGSGCLQAPSGHTLVAIRKVGAVRVIAVGPFDAGTMRKVLDSVR